MVAPSRTRASTPRLSDAARHVIIPEGIVTTGWPAVEAKAAELGITYDPWQQGAGRIVLGKRKDGKYAATVGGVTLSIPRQVGKTFWVGSLIVMLCILFPGLRVLWTAHHGATTANTFAAMQGLCRRRKVWPHIRPRGIVTGNGKEKILFRNGSSILFGAREHGFGRGLDAIDVEVFDEAQILKSKTLEDMVPATNQAQHPHGALLFFMGTPPTPENPGEEFTRRRDKALSRSTKNSVYIEFSADEDANADDRKQWAKANPSFPLRTPLESMLRMRENLGSDEAWLREALGIWVDKARVSPFGVGVWEDCAGSMPTGLGIGGLAIAVSYDLSKAAIVAASTDGEGVVHVKPLQHGPGTRWVAARAKDLQAKHRVPLVVDQRGPASDLIPALEAAGVHLEPYSTGDVLDACSAIFKRAQDRTIRHDSYEELDAAVRAAVRRDVQDRWAWGRKQSSADISTLEAATLAAWAATQQAPARSNYEDHELMVL
jgi:hypothetical protein